MRWLWTIRHPQVYAGLLPIAPQVEALAPWPHDGALAADRSIRAHADVGGGDAGGQQLVVAGAAQLQAVGQLRAGVEAAVVAEAVVGVGVGRRIDQARVDVAPREVADGGVFRDLDFARFADRNNAVAADDDDAVGDCRAVHRVDHRGFEHQGASAAARAAGLACRRLRADGGGLGRGLRLLRRCIGPGR
jgi:hypothetical protein